MRLRMLNVATVVVAAFLAHVLGSQPALATTSQQASPCLDGSVAVSADFGPRFAWTLEGIRYPDNAQCSMVYQNRSINGRMVLKIKMITKGVVTRKTERCFGCAAISFGTGGYDRVKIKAIAYKRGSTVAYDTGWRRLS